MQLRERLETDLKQAMRDRNEVARDTLRMLLAEIKNREIASGQDLAAEDAIAVLQKAVKTRLESVEQFDRAGRADLVAREKAEIAVVQTYLPQAMTEEETRAAIREILAETGVTAKKDLGVAMKAVMARHKGRIDGKLAQRILGESLA
jgi:uncharacterized protein YqeY